MGKSCTVSVNGQTFSANRGDVLLDAALVNGIELPHDCRAGQCGTCKLRILEGLTYGGDADDNGMVKACQARVITDLELLVEPVPEVVSTRGIVTGLRPLAPDVTEVRISLAKPVEYLPGQYYKFQFRGFPTRCFSPTAAMSVEKEDGGIRLHVRRVPGGRVSPALGTQIGIGHPVRLEGPFGAAYLRPGLPNRLVLVGSGTGFAPIWAIAEAALIENPMRQIVLIAAAKTFASLYMGPAARRVSKHPGVVIIPCASEVPRGVSDAVRRGRPTDHMPPLDPDDIVYACGAPPMVEAVKAMANEAGATFYADPFEAQPDDTNEGILAWALDMLYHFGGPAPRKLLEKPKAEERPAAREDAPPPRSRARPERYAEREQTAPPRAHRQPIMPDAFGHAENEPRRARPPRQSEFEEAPFPSRPRLNRNDDDGAVQPPPMRLVIENERAPMPFPSAPHDDEADAAMPPLQVWHALEEEDILPPHANPARNFGEVDEPPLPPSPARHAPSGFERDYAQPPQRPQARPAAPAARQHPRGEQRPAQIRPAQPAGGHDAAPPQQQQAWPARPAPSGAPQQRQQPWPGPGGENPPPPPRGPSRPARYAGDEQPRLPPPPRPPRPMPEEHPQQWPQAGPPRYFIDDNDVLPPFPPQARPNGYADYEEPRPASARPPRYAEEDRQPRPPRPPRHAAPRRYGSPSLADQLMEVAQQYRRGPAD